MEIYFRDTSRGHCKTQTGHSRTFKIFLNPILKTHYQDTQNPLFSLTMNTHMRFIVGTTSFYVNGFATKSEWLTSRDHLLQLNDSATQRYMILMSSMIAESLEDTSVPPSDTLLELYSWGDVILYEFGNGGYNSVKMWEPFLTGHFITYFEDHKHRCPGISEQNEFIYSQGDENVARLQCHLERLNGCLVRYDHLNADVLSQLFGIYRIWGHPTVDGLLGVIALSK